MLILCVTIDLCSGVCSSISISYHILKDSSHARFIFILLYLFISLHAVSVRKISLIKITTTPQCLFLRRIQYHTAVHVVHHESWISIWNSNNIDISIGEWNCYIFCFITCNCSHGIICSFVQWECWVEKIKLSENAKNEVGLEQERYKRKFKPISQLITANELVTKNFKNEKPFISKERKSINSKQNIKW